MQKFQNMEHSNSRTFKGLEFFLSKFKDFQGLLKDPMNPDNKIAVIEHKFNRGIQTQSGQVQPSVPPSDCREVGL